MLATLFSFNTDIDECEDPTLNNCDVNAMCINTCGSFLCMCNDGYFGKGTHCEPCNPEKPFYIGYTKNCTGILFYEHCAIDSVATPWHALDRTTIF